MIEEEVLAKAFWMIDIMISPGARKTRKGTPAMPRPVPPKARSKIRRNRSAVITGAIMVCCDTLKKRSTSLR